MQYRKDKYGNDISILGYGCMRFTRKGNQINYEKAEEEIMKAYELGVNYFDTAYIYPGSEEVLGRVLKDNNIRDKVNIATKLPQYMITDSKGINKYFTEELKRLRTDHIDYYLMHHLTDIEQWKRLKDIGIVKWIEDKKNSGEIRNIGFSYHGNTDNFLKILGDYDWDFCQIQYNYLDRTTQAGEKGLKAANEKGIPVVIMEPLRGGKLVNMLPEEAKKEFTDSGRNWSPAEWGLRWLYNQPEVTCVLSGMNSIEMVEENCITASDATAGKLTDDDQEILNKVVSIINKKEKVGCTGCRYCMPCPKGVDIPGTFACYNTMYTERKKEGRFQYAQTVALTREPSFASQCVGCGMCEKKCPQSINIREKLKEADKALRPLHYKIGINIARKYMFRKTKKK